MEKLHMKKLAGFSVALANVTVSLQQKTAVVTYDDSKTNVNALTAATTNAGYPSSPKS
jgi:mercuric ion binding protein